MDDTTIVELFLCREESAIKQTSEKYGRRLRSISFEITQNYEAVEECENDTYLEAWNSIPPHEPKHYLYAFLARIIRHISLNYCRNHSRLKRSTFICEISNEMEQCIPHPDDVECRMDEVLLQEAINNFLGTLSGEKRNIFLRRYCI